MIGKVLLHVMVMMAGLEESLGRDAPDVEARSAQRAAHLDAGGIEAELGRFDGGDVPAGSAADYHDVVLLRGGGGGGEGSGGSEGGGRGLAEEEGGGRVRRGAAEGGGG